MSLDGEVERLHADKTPRADGVGEDVDFVSDHVSLFLGVFVFLLSVNVLSPLVKTSIFEGVR